MKDPGRRVYHGAAWKITRMESRVARNVDASTDYGKLPRQLSDSPSRLRPLMIKFALRYHFRWFSFRFDLPRDNLRVQTGGNLNVQLK